jgi:hypothetical protein
MRRDRTQQATPDLFSTTSSREPFSPATKQGSSAPEQGADDFLDLLLRRRGRDPRRHHERHIARRLSQRLEHGPEAFGEFKRECLLVNGGYGLRMRHEELAEAILLSPALQRLHAILRHDRLPVVPLEAVTQCEGVLHAIRRDGGPANHLRFDLKALVRAEQGIVNEVAVVARDVGGRPNRVEDFQIGVRHEAKGLTALLGVDGRRAQPQCCGSGRASDNLSATDAVHWRNLPTRQPQSLGARRPSHPYSLSQNVPQVIEANLNCSESMKGSEDVRKCAGKWHSAAPGRTRRYVRRWHECDLRAAPTNVRSWESNGLKADVAFGPFMTQSVISGAILL